MKAAQLDQALADKFERDGHRIVFWHDEAGEFVDYLAAGFDGPLADVQLLDLRETGPFSAKLRLERESPDQRFVVYSQGVAPAPDADWLLDIRLYSGVLRADVASIWLQELGLETLSLRGHLKTRAKFLGNQDRRKKLARLVVPQDDATTLDRKMMAVVAGSTLAGAQAVFRALCHGHVRDGGFVLTEAPDALVDLRKYGLEDAFWDWMEEAFSYREDTPSLAGLLRRLFVSELALQLGLPVPASLAHFVLGAEGQRQASVFLTQWRDSNTMSMSYNAAAEALETELKVDEALAGLDLDAIQGVTTFWCAERRVAGALQQRLLETESAAELEDLMVVATARKAGHWLAGPGRDASERRALASAYDALVAAAEFFALHAQAQPRLAQVDLACPTPASFLQAYTAELYGFDQLYRRFCVAAGPARLQGWSLLKRLTEAVEKCYGTSVLHRMGVAWSRHLDAGFLDNWSVEGMRSQQDFFAHVVRPQSEGRGRAFVIVSDAFRYEAAVELQERLNGQDRMKAALEPMLGVLPSYTALGMASLLPHASMTYTDKGDVLVDGHSTAGTSARDKVLRGVGGVAIQASDLMDATTKEARALVGDAQVVYVYHNVIDARGDNRSTEDETFEAVTDCLDQLQTLVRICTSKLSATKVFVTADHGFLFQHAAPTDTDKSPLSYTPSDVIKAKKRYVIGRSLPETPEAHRGSTQRTAGTDDAVAFWIPRGSNRFHLVAGARFVHGGAMPQEAVVPLVTVEYLRGAEADKVRVEKVGVQVLGASHIITTPVHRFFLLQTDAVSDRRVALTARVAVYEGSRPVTSMETVVFDTPSKSMDDLKQSVMLKLASMDFDKKTAYRLVIRDVETDTEVQAVPVVIDRSFDDDLF